MIVHGEKDDNFMAMKREQGDQVLSYISDFLKSGRKPEHRLCDFWLKKWGRPSVKKDDIHGKSHDF